MKALIGPLLEVTVKEKALVNLVLAGEGLRLGGVPGPVAGVEGQVRIAAPLVRDAVPNSVEVVDTTDAGQLLFVATTVTSRIGIIDLGNGVQGVDARLPRSGSRASARMSGPEPHRGSSS